MCFRMCQGRFNISWKRQILPTLWYIIDDAFKIQGSHGVCQHKPLLEYKCTLGVGTNETQATPLIHGTILRKARNPEKVTGKSVVGTKLQTDHNSRKNVIQLRALRKSSSYAIDIQFMYLFEIDF